LVYGHYERTIDRDSAYEMLKARADKAAQRQEEEQASRQRTFEIPAPRPQASYPQAPRRPIGRPRDTLLEAMAKSAARSVGSQFGRQILRGVLGSILGGGRG
jgi:protein subunit release factor B